MGTWIGLLVEPEDAQKIHTETEGQVSPDEYHITLAHINDAAEEGEIERVVSEVSENSSPIALKLGELTRFDLKSGDIDAIVISARSEQISQLRRDVVRKLKDAGIGADERPFKPHITIAYIPKSDRTPEIEIPDLTIQLTRIAYSVSDTDDTIPNVPYAQLGNGSVTKDKERRMKKLVFMRASADFGDRTIEELKADPSLPITWVASSPGRKMDGFDLKPSNWDLSRYEQTNGPILFGHDIQGARHLPIGNGTRAQVSSDGRLRIDVYYDTDDEFAMKVRGKALKGMMMGSVTWRQRDGKNVLIEFSMVPVGIDEESTPELMRSLGMEAEAGFQQELLESMREAMRDAMQSELQTFIAEQFSGQIWNGKRVAPVHQAELAPVAQSFDSDYVLRTASEKELRLSCTFGHERAGGIDYHLLHHNRDGKVVWGGVARAMIGLIRGEAPIDDEDWSRAYDHLAGHYRDFGKTPPEIENLNGMSGVTYRAEEAVMFPHLFADDYETEDDDSRSVEAWHTAVLEQLGENATRATITTSESEAVLEIDLETGEVTRAASGEEPPEDEEEPPEDEEEPGEENRSNDTDDDDEEENRSEEDRDNDFVLSDEQLARISNWSANLPVPATT